MKTRTLADIRRPAGRTARMGTTRSSEGSRRTTVPSLSSVAKSHAGAWAIPRCSRTPVRICSRSESLRALRLEEKGYQPVYYLPREDADMSLLVRTGHYTYCPYKGDCTYYNISIGGSQSENAVWTYESPHESVAGIREYLAFYPSRVDGIEVAPSHVSITS
jgi:uncharacterized protein (DUF427 family)